MIMQDLVSRDERMYRNKYEKFWKEWCKFFDIQHEPVEFQIKHAILMGLIFSICVIGVIALCFLK